MPSNYTEHYQLNQWEADDQVLRTDFNADNAKIDAAIKAESDARAAAVAALSGQMSKCGNCSVGVFSYQGTGKYGADNPTRITFPKVPAAFIIIGNALLIGSGNSTRACLSYSYGGYGHTGAVTVSWLGNTLSLFSADADRQMNANATYTVVAFYAAE